MKREQIDYGREDIMDVTIGTETRVVTIIQPLTSERPIAAGAVGEGGWVLYDFLIQLLPGRWEQQASVMVAIYYADMTAAPSVIVTEERTYTLIANPSAHLA